MSKLLNNAMVLALELMLQVFSNLLPVNPWLQHSIPKTIESGESCKAFVVVSFIRAFTKPNKHLTRAGP